MDHLPPPKPVKAVQPLADPLRKVLQTDDDPRQLAFRFGLRGSGLKTRLQARHPRFQACHARLELALLDHALRIAVDEAANAPSQNPDLLVQLADRLRSAGSLTHLAKAPTELVGDALRCLKNSPDLLPHPLLKAVATHGRAVAHRRPAEPVGVIPDAPIIAQFTL